MNREPERTELERYFTGDLDQAHAGQIRDHVQNCSQCATYLKELEAERIRFLNVHPFEEFAGVAERESSVRPASFKKVGWVPKALQVPLSVIAVVMLLAPIVLVTRQAFYSGQDYAYKGASELTFLYKRNDVVADGDKSQEYQAGDRLQIFYSSSKKQQVTLFSVDNQGAISFYHPDQLSPFCSIASDSGNSVAYPASIILDDSSGEELVVVLLSSSPLKTDAVIKWVRKTAGNDFSDLARLEKLLGKKKLTSKMSLSTLMVRKG